MHISQSNRPVVAISMGDPSGVGPEIILKSLEKSSIRKLASYVIIGDVTVLQKNALLLNRCCCNFFKKIKVLPYSRPILEKNLPALPHGSVCIIDLKNVPRGSFSFGKKRAIYGKASIEYIDKAYELVKAGIADCIVTAPINKSAAEKAGFKFPGHTEYLASLSNAKSFVMMFVGGPFKISLVTRHIPISKVVGNLSPHKIAETIKITLDALRKDFNIPRPKIGVCALNPHSGESGMFGEEERRIIIPAIRKFRGLNVLGPISADVLFYDAYRGKYDSLICLYHDEGLIPFKMIARDSGVNVTLGLDFVRTSPDHGTAFDIAGKNKASSRSMEMAIKLAVSMAVNRKRTQRHK